MSLSGLHSVSPQKVSDALHTLVSDKRTSRQCFVRNVLLHISLFCMCITNKKNELTAAMTAGMSVL